jgi:hypothetical protein
MLRLSRLVKLFLISVEILYEFFAFTIRDEMRSFGCMAGKQTFGGWSR